MGTDMTRAGVLKALDVAWDEWDALASRVSQERRTEPGLAGQWTYKDVVAHLMAYERFVAAQIRAMVMGREPTPMEAFGTQEPPSFAPGMTEDDQNAMIYELYRSRTPEAIEQEARQVRKELVDAVRALPEDRLNEPSAWTGTTTVSERIAAETYRHREEHTATLRDWLERSESEG